MTTIGDLARTLRSKNAGAFALTLDVVMKDRAAYDRALQSPVLTPERIAAAYGVDSKDVLVEPYPQVLAVKVTMPRAIPSGDPGDSDVYGAQQHVPLMLLELDDRRRDG
jgi:hypothetical protein